MGSAQQALDDWVASNPGSDPSWAPESIRNAAWEEAGRPDYQDPIYGPGGSVTGYNTDPSYTGGGGGSGGALGGGGSYNQMMAEMQRRAALLSLVPNPNKDRMDRSLAAIFSNEQGVREGAVKGDWDVGDWRRSVQEWLGDRDALAYAVDQGYMPAPPPRTIEEAVDDRTLEILRGQGLMSGELESRYNARLQAIYDAEMAGTEAPAMEPGGVEGSRFLPPTPSMQLWNRVFNQAEREGTGQLFQAMGLLPSLLTDQIQRLAPPGGETNLGSLLFRRR